jgi:hypothetical protein
MADPTSTVPAVRAAIRDGLRAWSALSGVTIVAQPVPADRVEPKMIRLMNAETGGDQGYNTVGGRTRRETYAINGMLWYIATDKQGEAALDDASTVAYGLYGEVERFVWADPHLGSRVLTALPVFQRDEPTLFDTGVGLAIYFQVAITNELRRGG